MCIRDRDIDHIRKYICEINGDLKSIKLLSKIETNLGVDNFKEIIRYSDGIIIARGDLIPECGLINSVDKEFDLLLKVKKYEKEKEVIIATHILDNMRKGIIPNINELESIYTFVNLGVTGFLLASETSIGNYPVKSVEMLKMLINLYKKDVYKRQIVSFPFFKTSLTFISILLNSFNLLTIS